MKLKDMLKIWIIICNLLFSMVEYGYATDKSYYFDSVNNELFGTGEFSEYDEVSFHTNIHRQWVDY